MSRTDSGDKKQEVKFESAANLEESFTAFLINLQKTAHCSEECLQEKINLLPNILQQKISPKLIVSCCQWMSKNAHLLQNKIEDGTFSAFRGARFSKELTKLSICIHVTVNLQGKLLLVLDPKGKNINQIKDPESKDGEKQKKVLGSGGSKIVEYGLFVDAEQLLPAAVYVLSGDEAVNIIKKEQTISADIIQKNNGLLIPGIIAETMAGDEYKGHDKQVGIAKKSAFSLLAKGDLLDIHIKFNDSISTEITFAGMLCIVYSMVEGCRAVHHAGYLHRDVKMENYLLTLLAINNHTLRLARLSDFETTISSAKAEVEEKAEAAKGKVVGTINCYPPEHFFFAGIHNIHKEAIDEIEFFQKQGSIEKFIESVRMDIFKYHLFNHTDDYIKWRTGKSEEKSLQQESQKYRKLISSEEYINLRKSPVSLEVAQEEANKFKTFDLDIYKNALQSAITYKNLGGNKGKYIQSRVGEEIQLFYDQYELLPEEAFKLIVSRETPIVTLQKTNESTDLWSLYLDIVNLLQTFHDKFSLPYEQKQIKKIIDRSQANLEKWENRESAENFMKFLRSEIFIPLLATSKPGLENIKLLLDMDPKASKQKVTPHINLNFLSSSSSNSSPVFASLSL